MGGEYMVVLRKDENVLHYQRAPGKGSVFAVLAVLLITLLISFSGDNWVVQVVVWCTGVYVAYVATEKYEECIFDKKANKVTLCSARFLEKALFGYRKLIVMQLLAIHSVRVFSQESKRNKKNVSHQVILVFDSGLTLSMTSCLTYDPKSCHEKVVDEVREFLGIPEDPSASLAEIMREVQQEMEEETQQGMEEEGDSEGTEAKSPEEKKTD